MFLKNLPEQSKQPKQKHNLLNMPIAPKGKIKINKTIKNKKKVAIKLLK